jgi:glycerate kinase
LNEGSKYQKYRIIRDHILTFIIQTILKLLSKALNRMHILIAPDSFKDCMKAPGVAGALARGIRRVMPDADITLLPMADGGEGTVESVMEATGGGIIRVMAMDPLMREIEAFYGIAGDGRTAVIEMAAASGLELLSPEERDPWITSTCGTGQLIRHALDRGCTGMARALGIRFRDNQGREVEEGGGALGRINTIRLEERDPRIPACRIRVACDVQNPLTGPEGASRVYGPQKGAGPGMVRKLDANLVHLELLIEKQLGIRIGQLPGAGAAGGLGAGLVAFLGAELVKGFDLVSETVQLERAIRKADLVITGEGKLDAQTRFGKTPWGVAQLARRFRKDVIGVAGTVDEGAGELLAHGFSAIMPLVEEPMDLAESIRQAPELLERTGERIARTLLPGS